MRKLTLAALFLGLFMQSNAQLDVINFMNLGKKGVEDMETLTGAYLDPFGKGLATSLSSGWFNTARPHHALGFDFSVGVTFTSIPTDAKSFNLNDYNWKVLSFDNSIPNPISPTVAGQQDNLVYIGV
ncbi:MAG: hypothetical protein RBR35_20100, partial [Salinivirgaceae bacterium]|nr:hypothetical protein [Salinivirgaceae bacterium]